MCPVRLFLYFQEDAFKEMKAEEDVGGKKRKRMEGGGRRPLDADMEAKLYEWVKDLRERNLGVTVKL